MEHRYNIYYSLYLKIKFFLVTLQAFINSILLEKYEDLNYS